MYQKILVPLDGSELAEAVLPHVHEIIACNPAEVVFTRVVTYPHYDFLLRDAELAVALDKELENEARDYLEKVAAPFIAEGFKVTVKVLNESGAVSELIVNYAHQIGADLVAISAHGKSGYMNWLLGSVAERIVHRSGIPVLIVHPPKK